MPEDNCTFCKIVRKEVPAEIVYEDNKFLGILSIAPKTPGHTLVIPREHHRWVWDVPDFESYFSIARKIALAQRKAYDTDFIWSHVEGGEVPHAHIWVYPNPAVKDDKNDLATNAEKIRKAI